MYPPPSPYGGHQPPHGYPQAPQHAVGTPATFPHPPQHTSPYPSPAMNPYLYANLMTQAMHLHPHPVPTDNTADIDDEEESSSEDDILLADQIEYLSKQIKELKQEQIEEAEDIIPSVNYAMSEGERSKAEQIYYQAICELQRLYLSMEDSPDEARFEAIDLVSQLVYFFKGNLKPKYVSVCTKPEARNATYSYIHTAESSPYSTAQHNDQNLAPEMIPRPAPKFRGRSIPEPSKELLPPSDLKVQVAKEKMHIIPPKSTVDGKSRSDMVEKNPRYNDEEDSDTLSSRGDDDVDHPLVNFSDVRDIALQKLKSILYRMDMPVIDMFRLFCDNTDTCTAASMSDFMQKSGVQISKGETSKIVQTYDRNQNKCLHAVEFQELVGSLLGDSHLFKLNSKHLSKVKFEGFSTDEKYLMKGILDAIEADKFPPSKIYKQLLVHSKNDYLWSEAFCQALRLDHGLQFEDTEIHKLCSKFNPGKNGLSKSAFTRLIATARAF